MSDNKVFIEDMLIWLDAQDAANRQLRNAIKKHIVQNSEAPLAKGSNELPFNVNNIPWKPKQGDRGPFELSDNFENPDHKALLSFLAEIPAKSMGSQGFYYWTFPDGKTIGRKPSSQFRRPKT